MAILRCIHPEEAKALGEALVDASIRILEVPLNSPDPLDSIARLVAQFGARATINAGTVLNPRDVARVADVGGQIIVSPHATQP